MPAASVHLRAHDRVRLTTGVQGLLWPWNMQTAWSEYHTAYIFGGDVFYRRSDFTTPPFTITTRVTTGGTFSEPRMVREEQRARILLTYCDGSDTVIRFSDDDGASWSGGAVAITGGKHPTIQYDPHTGAVVVAAYVGGEIHFTIQYPGENSPSSPAAFRDDTDAVLTVEDDTFHVSMAREPQTRWGLAVRILDEGTVSHWTSAYEGLKWVRVS